MHLTIPRDTLVHLATRANAIIPDKPTNPLLGCAVLTANKAAIDTESRLIVRAGSREMTYIGEHPVTVLTPGTIAVDTDNLLRAAKALPSGIVDLDVDMDRMKVTLKIGRNVLKVDGMDPTDYPPPPTQDDAPTMVVDAEDLRNAIDYALTCAKNAPNDVFSSVQIEYIAPNFARFFGMDGNRLGWLEVPYTGEIGGGSNSLVPQKTMVELRNLIGAASGPISLAIGNRSMVVTLPGVTFHSLMMEAVVPDYHQIVPKNFKRTVTVDRAELLGAIRRGLVFANQYGAIRASFDAGQIVLSASKVDAGSVHVEVDAELAGTPLVIGLNGAYVIDALNVMVGAKAVIEMSDHLGLVTVRDPDDVRASFIVAPMRLEGV